MNSKLAREIVPQLRERYRRVRQQTRWLCEPLAPEDCVIQTMPDVSPIRWHLAHTTWFFETFVLKSALPGYRPYHDKFDYLFNSYYNTVGVQFPRDQRGLLSRPTIAEIDQYRQAVDDRMDELLTGMPDQVARLLPVFELGLQHEQQHQELMLTDIKHVFSLNPLRPVYRERHEEPTGMPPPLSWVVGLEGVQWIGHDGTGFAFDNERPWHQTFVQPHALASRLTTNGEYLEFMEDGGYQRPEFWLSLGWQTVLEACWTAPLYWIRQEDEWWQFTLSGVRPVDPCEPVCHVSYFEADAYARWAGARLPTESEWEVAATNQAIAGNFVEQRNWHPIAAPHDPAAGLAQMFGDVWQWTSSPYTAYPGYVPPAGAIGEYNGKFMCNQYVLRGGSCVTPGEHVRATYRNFFPPSARWQFSGIRLAR